MSDKLAPSRSTVYVSNLPFQLTNNDLHQIFEKHGKVVKVTIVKDRQTRKSKGVAFVLYLHREDALKCIQTMDQQTLMDRQLKCSIAKDNGRAEEFIRKRVYPDKSRCYECGEEGHLSYQCSKNSLGEREPPKKNRKSRKKDLEPLDQASADDEDDREASEGEDPALDSLGAAIRYEQECKAREQEEPSGSGSIQRKKFKPNSYFSDEEDLSD